MSTQSHVPRRLFDSLCWFWINHIQPVRTECRGLYLKTRSRFMQKNLMAYTAFFESGGPSKDGETRPAAWSRKKIHAENSIQRSSVMCSDDLVLVEVFLRHIIFGKLTCSNLFFIGIVSLFHAFYGSGFESISLFEQLADALRIRTLDIGQAL